MLLQQETSRLGHAILLNSLLSVMEYYIYKRMEIAACTAVFRTLCFLLWFVLFIIILVV